MKIEPYKNFLVRDLVELVDNNFESYCARTSWTINRTASFLIEKNILGCPVIHGDLKDGETSRIRGYIFLKDIVLKLKNHGELKIDKYIDKNQTSTYDLIDNQLLVDKISALYKKPFFCVKNNRNKYYAIIFQKDVFTFLHSISSRFMYLRAIETKITKFIYSINNDDSIFKKDLREKIDSLVHDKIWDKAKIGFDKIALKKILIECCEIRNQYFHFHDINIDKEKLKNGWKIIKEELKNFDDDKVGGLK